LVATSAIAVLPLVLVSILERVTPERFQSLQSPLLSATAGVILSMLFAATGSALWARHRGSKDLVFGDLMIWGWLRRLRMERRLSEMTRLLGLAEGAASDTRELRAETLRELASLIEENDPYTHGHTRRVTRHSHMIAKTMGLPRDQVEKIRAAAAVHDVGKLHIPREILHKQGELTEEDVAVIKTHATLGSDMVSKMGDPEITAMVRHHHERLDGKGYPDGLSGDAIPLGARVIAVADTFDAITSTRPYREACKHKKAIEILKRETGSQLDPEAVSAFLAYYSGRSSLEWWAALSTAPQRFLAWSWSWFQKASAAGIAQAAAAVGTAALVVGSVTPAWTAPAEASAGEETASYVSRTVNSDQPSAMVSSEDVVSAADEGSTGQVSGEAPAQPAETTTQPPVSDEKPGATDPLTDPVTDPLPTDPVTDLTDPVTDPVNDLTDPVTDPVTDLTDPLIDPVADLTDPLIDPVADLTDPLIDPVGGVGDVVDGLLP
jgi:hypothetical protein